jgi:hypothetical protein
MYQDEIIAEVWRHRDEYVAEHHHNMAEIISDLKRRQSNPHGKLVDRRPNKASEPTADRRS